MTKDWHKLKALLYSIFPERVSANANRIGRAEKAMAGFIIVLILFTMIIVFIGLFF